MDPEQQQPVPIKKTLVIVNHFIIQTTRFLNHFSTLAEEKLQKVFHDINRIETTLVLLESRLHRLDGFDDLAAPVVTNSVGGAPSSAAPAPSAAEAPALPPLPQLAGPGGPAAPPPPVASADAPAAPPPAPAPEAPPIVKCKDDPALAKYFRMHKIGAALQAIQMQMRNDGYDPAWIELDPESESPLQKRGGGGGGSSGAPAPAPPPAAAAAAPAPAAPMLALMPPPAPAPAPAPARPAAPAGGGGGSGVSLQDCPVYGPFLKKVRMGIPRHGVELLMTNAGLDPSMLDRDPSYPSPA